MRRNVTPITESNCRLCHTGCVEEKTADPILVSDLDATTFHQRVLEYEAHLHVMEMFHPGDADYWK
jgi:hypothetical protein